jgi:hypothetical protein
MGLEDMLHGMPFDGSAVFSASLVAGMPFELGGLSCGRGWAVVVVGDMVATGPASCSMSEEGGAVVGMMGTKDTSGKQCVVGLPEETGTTESISTSIARRGNGAWLSVGLVWLPPFSVVTGVS